MKNSNSLETDESIENKKSLFEAVPALQLLSEDAIDYDEENENMTIEGEVVHESGDIVINEDNNSVVLEIPEPQQTTTQQTPSHSLSSTGRLLESESEWHTRPKVTYNGNAMTFRPLRMKCTHCEEAYTKTHDLYGHIRSHQNHTTCPHCNKKLTCMATFVYHVRTHTTEKPYYCPVEGCDFKNAVKYNLKVHLACIRHGGKENLKKYAKVLDLDVCAKSLSKRKDNSVHELGSRRSKKRRKLNKKNKKNGDVHQTLHDNYNHNHNMNDTDFTNLLNVDPHSYSEYDQYAAQLLFSLSAIPPAFNQNQMNHPLVDWNAAVKSEQNDSMLKPEQHYDPLCGAGYYLYNSANPSLSASASTIWPDQQQKLENNNNNYNNDGNSEDILIPKQEPIYSDFVTNPPYTLPSFDIHSNNNLQCIMPPPPALPPNMYYPQTAHPHPSYYYLNNENAHLLYSNPSTNQININNDDQQDYNNNNNKKIEVPPLPIQFLNSETG